MSKQTQSHSKKYLWLRIILLFVPFLPVIVIYFISDPFMVLHEHKRFDHTNVMLNEAYVGWNTYLNNRDSISYNSYILGNSCTMAFKSTEWKKHLKETDRVIRFFDNNETLGGIEEKLWALDTVGASIKNILLILNKEDFKRLFPMKTTKHLYDYQINQTSKIEFQLRFLQEFLYPDFMIPYIKYFITNKYDSSMRGIMNPGPPIREPYTNDFINPRETEIALQGENYWVLHNNEFPPRKAIKKEEACILSTGQDQLCYSIKKLCKKHNSHLKIIIGPDYYQEKMNKKDMERLNNIFGQSVVYDFTGINEYTNDIHHYYEQGHYRPTIGKHILDKIYQRTN